MAVDTPEAMRSSASSAFRWHGGGRGQAVIERDAGRQELPMEFLRAPRGELSMEKCPDFGGTDVE